MTIEEFMKDVGGAALCNTPTLWNTYDLSKKALSVPGDLVECGVFCGTQPAIMARVLVEAGEIGRRVHLFDSFEGIPESGPNDDRSITDLIGIGKGRLVTTGISACSLENVKGNMKRWELPADLFVYHHGWFQDVLPGTNMGDIALLRLDGDLYESTIVCLRYLYHKVVKGGWIIIDDYALTGCKKAVTEFLATCGAKPDIIPIEGGGGPVYWQKK